MKRSIIAAYRGSRLGTCIVMLSGLITLTTAINPRVLAHLPQEELMLVSSTLEQPPSGGAGSGQGTAVGGASGSGFYAQSDDYSYTNRGWAALYVFRNDSYGRKTTVTWSEPSYGVLELRTCETGESCFMYWPYSEGPRPDTDRFQYRIAEGRVASVATVSIHMP